ncbi:superoxide dismutase, Ni [Ferrimonas sp. YFM]|uniref:superoxide dismutase, Ni n=1 Tax=Ferrimonas sp. YFM TaxID=3028878 RepID=UPI002573614D|nr:superoxide dismutase, Ni [Ferrimonas sp. YFM]
MMKRVLMLLTLCLGMLSPLAWSHCQVPCGIYDDHARVKQMLEDAATVAKASAMMAELAGKGDAQSQNQMVRWVMNKEQHAQKVISTISDYFLTQRVKSSQKDYQQRLVKHHEVIVAAMKAKQNADPKFADALSKAIEALAPYYPEHKH